MRPIVLAAGASSRMGHPKALTRIDGEPALSRIVQACRGAGLSHPVIVLGHHHERIREELPDLAVEWVVNRNADAGRTGSLQLGLRAARVEEALVWPVDHPLARAETAAALARAQGEWVVPEHAGRRGHPIVLRGGALSAVLRASPRTPLREALAGVLRTEVEFDDPGILANLDSPADLDGLLRKGS